MDKVNKIAFAIIANKRIRNHSTGSWHKDVATIVGDFFDVRDSNIIVEQSTITIELKRPLHAYYLNKQFDRIVIEQVEHRSRKNLPQATLYLGEEVLRIYEPYDWYTEYQAYDYDPHSIIESFNEAKRLNDEVLIVTSDGGLYIDKNGCGPDRAISDLNIIHGII